MEWSGEDRVWALGRARWRSRLPGSGGRSGACSATISPFYGFNSSLFFCFHTNLLLQTSCEEHISPLVRRCGLKLLLGVINQPSFLVPLIFCIHVQSVHVRCLAKTKTHSRLVYMPPCMPLTSTRVEYNITRRPVLPRLCLDVGMA